jgi:hypothetical protein
VLNWLPVVRFTCTHTAVTAAAPQSPPRTTDPPPPPRLIIRPSLHTR